jgi:hypothetical protein
VQSLENQDLVAKVSPLEAFVFPENGVDPAVRL